MSDLKHGDGQLVGSFGFTEEDLEANRDGYLSPSQRVALRRVRRGWRDWSFLTVIVCAFASMIAVLDGIRVGDPLERRTSVIGLICVATAVVFTVCYQRWQQYQKDLWKGDVAVIIGNISVTQYEERFGTKCVVRVSRRTFTVDALAAQTLHNGERYAIYYSPHSGKLLSAELLPANLLRKTH
jgi:hypothetical protein